MNFWSLFRLIFTAFSLYLMGDAFYRWDGFKYYASFSEFLPAIALISILWSFLSLLTSAFIWFLLRIIRQLSSLFKFRIGEQHVLLSLVFFFLFGMVIWSVKTRLYPEIQSSLSLKLGIASGTAVMSIFAAWLFREKSSLWINTVNQRITPLVWMYGMIVLVSFPAVGYLMWTNQGKQTQSKEITVHAGDKGRPNIILMTFDALTVQDMSAYGYEKETTPFISEWAKSAAVFKGNQAASNYTSPTSASLMTGKRAWTHRRFQSNGGKTDKSDIESLPLLLKNNGYYNMAFIANSIASVQELGMFDSFMVAPPSHEFMISASVYGFLNKYLYKLFGTGIQLYDWILQEDFILFKIAPDEYFKYPGKMQFPVKKVFDMFISEIDSNKHSEPYFAWIHVYPPHLPYLPPGEYAGLFDTSQKYRTAKSQDDLVRPRYFDKGQQPDADILRARYDEFIRYCDKEFQNVIERLEEKNILKNTVIILSSDHGEGFEHGYLTHGGPFLFEEMTNIPLIIKEPGQTEGKIFLDFVEQIDTPATIMDLVGITVPSWVEGRSLVPLLRGGELKPKPAFSMQFWEVPVKEKITKGTIAVWEGDYKLIHYLDNKKSLLFNLKHDPDELNDLYEKEPEVSKYLLDLILHNLDMVNERNLKLSQYDQ